MNRRNLICLVSGSLCACATLALGSTASAQQSEADRVKAALDGFHAALGSLDVNQVGEFWVHEPYVRAINPRDKSISVGWEAVRKSYEATFGFWSELKVSQKDEAHVRVNGDVAWVDGITMASGKPKAGDAIAGVLNFETCVLEKRDGRWLLVSRSVWRMP